MSGVFVLHICHCQGRFNGTGQGPGVEEPLVMQGGSSLRHNGKGDVAARKRCDVLRLSNDGERLRSSTFTGNTGCIKTLHFRRRKGAPVKTKLIDSPVEPDSLENSRST